MLKNIKTLQEYGIFATDGEIGKVHDFLFDDNTWDVRYLVVDTGNWLPGRKVLIYPSALEVPDWEQKKIPVNLTKEKIQNSPDVDTDKPVSRQSVIGLHSYYGWVPYPFMQHPIGADPATIGALPAEQENKGDPNLRSAKEVMGYGISSFDENTGSVDDFILDCKSWIIRYIVIDIGNILSPKKVVISPLLVRNIDWLERVVFLNVTKDKIETSPIYDPKIEIDRDYENRLYEYYNQPKYWES